MTLSELEIKRKQVLESLGIARAQYGERSIQYAGQKEALAVLDNEIAKASTITTPTIGRFYSREGL